MSLWRRCSNELVHSSDTRVPKRQRKDKQTSLALSRNVSGMAPRLAFQADLGSPKDTTQGREFELAEVDLGTIRRSEKSGGGGIRTHERLATPTVFETAPFNHSGTPPGPSQCRILRASLPCGDLERCPSGLRSATGNRVGGVNPPRGFESHPLRFVMCRDIGDRCRGTS